MQKKPAGSKWDLINPTGPFLEVVDVKAETTVEEREVLMMGPAICDLTSFKVVSTYYSIIFIIW